MEDLKNRQKLSEEKTKAEIAKQDGDGKLSPEEAWPLMLSFIHQFLQGELESLPGEGEVDHPSQAHPDGLRAGGRLLGAIVVAPEFCHEFHQLSQLWRPLWRGFLPDDLPDRLPFLLGEDHLAREIRALSVPVGQVENPPGDDLVERQAVLHPTHRFQLDLFDLATGL